MVDREKTGMNNENIEYLSTEETTKFFAHKLRDSNKILFIFFLSQSVLIELEQNVADPT